MCSKSYFTSLGNSVTEVIDWLHIGRKLLRITVKVFLCEAMEKVRYPQDLFNTILDWTTREVPRPSIWCQCLLIRVLFDPDSHPGHWTQIFLCFLAWFVDSTPSVYQSFWNITSALAPAPLGWGLLKCSRVVFLSLPWTVQLGLQESVGTQPCTATVCVCVLVTQSCPTLFDPTDHSPPGSSVHECSRLEYWRGLLFPSLGNLPNPGVEPRSSTCLLQGSQIL